MRSPRIRVIHVALLATTLLACSFHDASARRTSTDAISAIGAWDEGWCLATLLAYPADTSREGLRRIPKRSSARYVPEDSVTVTGLLGALGMKAEDYSGASLAFVVGHERHAFVFYKPGMASVQIRIRRIPDDVRVEFLEGVDTVSTRLLSRSEISGRFNAFQVRCRVGGRPAILTAVVLPASTSDALRFNQWWVEKFQGSFLRSAISSFRRFDPSLISRPIDTWERFGR